MENPDRVRREVIDLVLLVIALLGLWAGTELVVGSSVQIASRFGLSEIFIGLTVLSIGSDLPELAVAVDAGFRTLGGEDSSGIVVGSSVGSAFGQIGLVMGISGLVGFMALTRTAIIRHGTALLGSIGLLFLVGWDGTVTRAEGLILLAGFGLYIMTLCKDEAIWKTTGDQDQPVHQARLAFHLVLGLVMVVACSSLTVRSATNLAMTLHVDQTLIAIVIIGIGTSLPELTISIGAILKKRAGLSIGNLIGSNVLDVLVPVGLAATISPLTIGPGVLRFDLPALFVLSFMVLAFLRFERGLQKKEAAVILLFYFAYILTKFIPPG